MPAAIAVDVSIIIKLVAMRNCRIISGSPVRNLTESEYAFVYLVEQWLILDLCHPDSKP